MSYYVKQERFDLSKETIDVAGTFNNWGGTRLNLTLNESDTTFSRTISGFTVGKTIEFKFRINGAWNGREEFPGGGNNRRYTVAQIADTLSVWYNDDEPASGPPKSEFTASSTNIVVGQQVLFRNDSEGIIDAYFWEFEGGIPSTSTQKEPLIVYPEQGSFSVQLITSNKAGEADTLIKTAYISVTEKPIVSTRWWNGRVFYEIFIRSFYDSNGDGIGDINGIIEKLDYLNDGDPNTTEDLGIGGIWLMPIHPSPSYHGYDVTDYRGVHPQYGTLDDFKRLVSEAHKRGIAIIIDYVMNHTSSEHEWFKQSANNNPAYRDYYIWKNFNPNFSGPWGQQVWHNRNGSYYYGVFWGGMPDLNYENQTVKDSIFNAASFWINETGVDGFRLDAVKYIFEDGTITEDLPQTHQFFADFSAHIKHDNPDVFTVGEAWTSTDKVLEYVVPDRIDYCFEFDIANGILNAVNSGNSQSALSAINNAYYSYPNQQMGLFLTNHDINRVQNVVGNSVGKNKAAASVYLTLPGVPYMYYGEEIGMTGQKPDEFIRTPMHWNNSSHSGFTTGNPWIRVNSEYNSKNVSLQTNDENSLLSHYRKLVHLRNENRELQTGELTFYPVEDERVLLYSRSLGNSEIDSTLIVVTNLSNQNLTNIPFTAIGLSENPMIFDVIDLMTQTEFSLPLHENGNNLIPELKAYQTYVLRVTKMTLSSQQETEPVRDRFELLPAFPNPFNPTTTVRFTLAQSGMTQLTVYDALGRTVQTVFQEFKPAGNHQIQLNLSGFASGMYILQLQQAQNSSTQKISLIK